MRVPAAEVLLGAWVDFGAAGCARLVDRRPAEEEGSLWLAFDFAGRTIDDPGPILFPTSALLVVVAPDD